MAETIAQLRERCQEMMYPTDSLYVKYCRKISIYVTSLLVRTPITANQFTCLFLTTGLIASSLFLLGTPGSTILGALMLQVWFVFDCVDGELARYRNTASIAGMYFDRMTHAIVRAAIFACLGLGLFRTTQHVWVLAAGSLAAVSAVLVRLASAVKQSVIQDARELALQHTFFSQLLAAASTQSSISNGRHRLSFLGPIVALVTRDPSVLNLLLFAGVLDILGGSSVVSAGRIRAVEVVVGFYAGLLTYLWVKTVYRTVRQGQGMPWT